MKKWADVSECGEYRYSLTRRWDIAFPLLTFLMLNPSTADAEEDDQTIRKCIGFARSWGYGGIDVVNLYAFRSTDPKQLVAQQSLGKDIVGPGNNDVIFDAMRRAADASTQLVCAWGSIRTGRPRTIETRVVNVKSMARTAGVTLQCIGRTKDGDPRHPLMVAYNVPCELWP